MRITFLGIAAASLGGLICTPTARAADTMLLAGVGSMNSRDVTAPAITLKGDATTKAETIDVFYGRVARGVAGVGRFGFGGVRWAARYPFYRAWGGFRPWGWYRPWFGYYRPWGLYRPWFYPGFAANVGIGSYAAAYPSTYDSGYSGAAYGQPPMCDCSSYAAPTAGPGIEMAPPPRPNAGYRYDGGPPHPIPAPRPAGPQTPPPPMTIDTVARRTPKKLEYPAYGEPAGKPRAPADLLLVRAK